VFLRPSVIAEDVDDDDFDCDGGGDGGGAAFDRTHPNCKFNFFVDDDDDDDIGVTESFAETCADRNRKLSTNMSTALLETDAKPFFIMLLRSLLIICFVLLTMQLNTTDINSHHVNPN
jgi:hypothetical protein